MEGAIAIILLLRVPSDPESAFFWGLSKSRFIIFSVLLLVEFLVLWMTIHFWQNSKLSFKISKAQKLVLDRRYVIWLAIVGLELGLVISAFGLSQWGLVASDQQLRGYLQRLTPFLILGLFGTFQGLGVLMLVYRQRLGIWGKFLKIIGSGYGLFLLLFVVEFYILDASLPWLFIQETYGNTFLHFITLAIPQWVLLAQWVLTTGELKRLRISHFFYFLLLLCTAVFYFRGANQHAQEINTEIDLSDQLGFVGFTQAVSRSNFRHTGNRNQAPGYPYIQAVFCGNQTDEMTIFSCGKVVNIWLSIILLGVIFWMSKKDLGLEAALCLTLVTTFSIFIFKAGYFKVDLAYYFASFVSFYLMVRMLISPTLVLGLITGIALGLTQLLKASALPGMVLFVLVLLVICITSYVKDQRKGKTHQYFKSLWKALSIPLLVFVGFLAVQSPYLWENQQRYGSIFYNVNTEVYLWYDSFEEAKQARSYFDEYGTWPRPYENSTPGLVPYLKTHTFHDILDRLWNGIRTQIYYLIHLHNPINYLIFYALTLIFLIALTVQTSFLLARSYFIVIIFVSLYIGGYFLLYTLYTPIGSGPRFIYSLFLPVLWSMFSAIQFLSHHTEVKLRGNSIATGKIMIWIHRLVIALVTYDAAVVLIWILPQGYFGS
jgi:hypothetical protein